MSLNKNTKPVQIDSFEPASDIKWLRCAKCKGHINRFGEAKADPLTFGGIYAEPEMQPFSCEISCQCGATTIRAWGKTESIVVGPHSCFGVNVSTELVFDKPCFCRETKGSDPGHIHASLPYQEKP